MEESFDFGVFSVQRRLVERPGGVLEPFNVLRCPDWVSVLAFTVEGRLALVRQFRYGVEGETIEFPGGIIDANSSPLRAAQLELQEEAGLVSDNWCYIGRFRPNSALQNNWCHSFYCDGSLLVGRGLDADCGAIFVDEETFKKEYKAILFEQALMLSAVMLALQGDNPSDLKSRCARFFT